VAVWRCGGVAGSRQYSADSKQHTADSRQQTATQYNPHYSLGTQREREQMLSVQPKHMHTQVRPAERCPNKVCIKYIGVVSKVSQYNCVYYCDTCIRRFDQLCATKWMNKIYRRR
jgi:hypothetical protein